MSEWLRILNEHWPTVGLVITLLVGVYLAARYWNAAEMRDMRNRVDYLDRQMRALRYRDQCYFEYVLFVEGYQRRIALAATAGGYSVEKPVSFLEFRDRWMLEHRLQDEQDDIWQT